MKVTIKARGGEIGERVAVRTKGSAAWSSRKRGRQQRDQEKWL